MNKLCHFEIPTTDFEKAGKFFTELFGWEIEAMPGMDYAIINVKDSIGGGLTKEYKPGAEFGFSLYFEVDDIPGTIAKAKELGGEEVMAKAPIGDGSMGYLGQFKDLDGNTIGLWSKA
jgi:predicted enzyme related to lactoylglutathione lyase